MEIEEIEALFQGKSPKKKSPRSAPRRGQPQKDDAGFDVSRMGESEVPLSSDSKPQATAMQSAQARAVASRAQQDQKAKSTQAIVDLLRKSGSQGRKATGMFPFSTARDVTQGIRSAAFDAALTPEQTLKTMERQYDKSTSPLLQMDMSGAGPLKNLIERTVARYAFGGTPEKDIDPALMARLPELKQQAEMEALKAYERAMQEYLEKAGVQLQADAGAE